MITRNQSLTNQSVTQHWVARAQYWIKWAEYLSSGDDEFTARMIEAIDLRSGHDTLDLASGPGEPALKIAKIVGSNALMIATDIVPDMLSGLKKRGDLNNLKNLYLAAADMRSLPFPKSSFDRVTCRFGIMFVENPIVPLIEMKRVLKLGGRAALMFWGPKENTPIFKINHEVATEVFGLTEPKPDKANRFGTPGSITTIMRKAGFSEITELDHYIIKEEPIDKPFWRPYFEMTFGPQLQKLQPNIMECVDKVMVKHLKPYQVGNKIQLRAHMRLAVAVVHSP